MVASTILDGQVALVTGAGIGLAISRTLGPPGGRGDFLDLPGG
jgi:NAD(P)-dependent dehydrogenase (short-subunit alcohol dehydrogenase family)